MDLVYLSVLGTSGIWESVCLYFIFVIIRQYFYVYSVEEYDRYGFSRKHYIEETEEEQEYDPLTSKAAVLEKQSEELNTKVKVSDALFFDILLNFSGVKTCVEAAVPGT